MHLKTHGGLSLQLGAVLARAGEGTIYELLGHPDLVAKVFHPELKDLSTKMAKVAAMLATPPDGAVQSDGFVVLTWPTDLLDGSDGYAGYLMPRIDTSNAVEIHTVSNPSNRANPLPSAPSWTPNVTWSHLVNVAANLCLAVDVVHRVDAVIGDFQERNILVNDTTRVTLVDCDSMQFTDRAGRQYLCGVARPEFTAPELAGVDLVVTARHKPSDLFALAVHIHLLLMAGNHPFLRGEWTGIGEQPDALALARSGQWAGGPGSALHTHPLAPPVNFLPPDIEQLFARAFTDGARNPSDRPAASEWRDALLQMQLSTCPRGHQIPVEADPCPWCVVDDRRAARRNARASSSTTSNPDQVVYQVDPSSRGYVTPGPILSTLGPAPVRPASSNNRNMFIALGIGGFLLIGLLVAFLIPSGTTSVGDSAATPTRSSTPYTTLRTTTSSVPPPPARPAAQPPPSATPCGEPVAGTYSRAAAGTSITSCPFAISVRDAVNAAGVTTPRLVNAYSPVTRTWYAMTCVMEGVLTCRGGNDAVVYVY
ncbi:hypothetical protein [Mycobacterium sp. SMC-4]|uniref:hypothetical protein n=1 Tax=Mycobacterium sp. SMC-4 TaxID=2857059 RepID=UPI0021B1FE04|nr:hypothetical protein [Mycobacterium sp. SMC-4]UXA20591.1 hypothetical protein KXD98_05355 [Mycobacterium sp. SMC-4]